MLDAPVLDAPGAPRGGGATLAAVGSAGDRRRTQGDGVASPGGRSAGTQHRLRRQGVVSVEVRGQVVERSRRRTARMEERPRRLTP